MAALEINLVVSDLETARVFYAALGCGFRPILNAGSAANLPPSDEVQAWAGVDGPLPVTLHRLEFARWWDTTGPAVAPGSTVIDVTVDRTTGRRMLDAVPAHGGNVSQPWQDMPWGQSYAIFTDPDGYRWGIKTETE